MATALTLELGKFVSRLSYEQIPSEVLESIRTAFTDCVAVMIAGAREAAPQLLRSMLMPGGGEATLLVGGGRGSALDAAWINGTAAHALDFDDVAQRGGTPSSVLVPAILAEAEAVAASGEQMVAAYAAGYETYAELARRDPDDRCDKGWHETGIFGPLGAAAACAKLRGLDAKQSAMAIALGASQGAGLMSNFGTMTKPFHAGRAAHAGIASARLAGMGFTAASDAIEHAPGFLQAVSQNGRVDLDSPLKAGTEWQISGSNRLAVKKYPICYCTHRAIDGLLDLRAASKPDLNEVERVTVTLSRRNAANLRNHAPQTGLEAKFSIEFAMACALIAGRVGLTELSDEFVRRPDVQALMKRVAVVLVEGDDPRRPGYAKHDRVVIEARGGHVTDSGPIVNVRGDPELPLRRAEMWEKFESCVRAGGARMSAEKSFEALMSLGQRHQAQELMALLTDGSQAAPAD